MKTQLIIVSSLVGLTPLNPCFLDLFWLGTSIYISYKYWQWGNS